LWPRQSSGQLAARVGVGGIERQGPLEIRDGLCRTAGAAVHDAERDVHRRE
jgi:hypothetical protein